jgi:excinuclease UvrABC nuclease subunit
MPSGQRDPGHTCLYRYFDADGNLLYVGMASNPLSRLTTHAASKPWWHELASAKVEHFETRIEAERAETEAIERERPRYNRHGIIPRSALANMTAAHEATRRGVGRTHRQRNR